MNAAWKFKPTTKPTQLLFQAYADAFGRALIQTLQSVVITTGTVVGGASIPGGPVVGATLSFAPGTLTSKMLLDIETVFVPPAFPGGSYTPWLRAFTACLGSTIKSAYGAWIKTWNMPGAAVAGGGIATYVPTPPTPGTWYGGTITTPCFFMAPGFGMNVSTDFVFLANSFVRQARITNVQIMQGIKAHNLKLVATSEGEHLARTVAQGLADMFNDAVSKVMVIDKSSQGLGTVVPPTGSVVGGVISNCVLDV